MYSMTSRLQISKTMNRVYLLMTLGLGLTALISGLIASSPAAMAFFLTGAMKWVSIFGPLALVFVLSLGIEKMSPGTALALFLVYAASNGILFSTIFLTYTTASILAALLSATALFAVMSIYGMVTKRSLDELGSFCFVGLIALLIAMIINIFLQSSVMTTVISCVGVLIFLGLTAYDTQKLRDLAADDEKGAIMGALSLYLDFLNLFTFLLKLMGNSSDD